MSKLLKITALFIALIALAVWSPWNSWNINFFRPLGIDQQQSRSGIKLSSLGGELELYIDDEYKGTTTEGEQPLEIFDLTPGEKLVTIKRIDDPLLFTEIVRKINFEAGVDVVIGYEIGPSEAFSEGHIFYARKNFANQDKAYLDISSAPSGIEVTVDDTYIGQTPIQGYELDINKKHKLKFEKDGHDSLEIEIFPDNQEDRNRLTSLTLILEVNLFARPISVKSI